MLNFGPRALLLSLPLLGGCAAAAPAPAADPRETELAAARRAWEADPAGEERIIWYGRRLAYLGRYEEAIEVYSRGLEIHPHSYRLLRHRGHRWITLRRFDLAERDLARASELIRGVPDAVEPDGMPNAAGVPRSTSHSNVEYHLGLALYLQGRYQEAEQAYRRCLAYAQVNDDLLCATLYWLHLALLRQGRAAEALAQIAAVGEEMEILENHAYHELLLMLQGKRTPEQVLVDHPPGSLEHATRAYGISIHFLAAGRGAAAEALWRSILDNGDPPASFGFIAAEVELAR